MLKTSFEWLEIFWRVVFSVAFIGGVVMLTVLVVLTVKGALWLLAL